jgi:hypothetical protein
MELRPQQKALAALNVVGGMAVLASYILAFAYRPEVRAGLWGGVPVTLQPLYTACMLLAAAGYFPFTYLLVLRLRPDEIHAAARVPFGAVIAAYALILFPSAAWLPLTAALLQAPSGALWWSTRAVLALVAVGSSTLLGTLAAIVLRRGGTLAWIAVAGCVPFWIQTAILDALVWPAYFPR